MKYIKQNFESGHILMASEMNHMEDGIENASYIEDADGHKYMFGVENGLLYIEEVE